MVKKGDMIKTKNGEGIIDCIVKGKDGRWIIIYSIAGRDKPFVVTEGDDDYEVINNEEKVR